MRNRLGTAAALGGFLLALAGGAGAARALGQQEPEPSEHGRRALAIAPESWKREETAHFVLHYTNRFVGVPVGVEAEFYRRVITAELGVTAEAEETGDAKGSKDTKSHIYVFESAPAWGEFVRSASLEEWTGAAAIGSDLFLPRYPQYKFKGNALGHEVAHLLVRRHLGQLPLWLSEGYAEDVSSRAYAAFQRARGYRAKPRSPAPARLYPLRELFAITAYPAADRVGDFYRQSRLVAGFLHGAGAKGEFGAFLRAMAGGEPVEAALRAAYGRWDSVEALERDFLREQGRRASGREEGGEDW